MKKTEHVVHLLWMKASPVLVLDLLLTACALWATETLTLDFLFIISTSVGSIGTLFCSNFTSLMMLGNIFKKLIKNARSCTPTAHAIFTVIRAWLKLSIL